MTAISGNFYTLAFGKQVAKGTPQTTPTFKLKVTGGDVSPARQEIELAETDASRQQSATVVVGSQVEGSPDFYVRPDDFGLLAFGLLGANANGGTAVNYIHTATMSNSGALPYFTIYKAIGGSVLVDRYDDCRISSMKIKGQAGQALSVTADIKGLTANFGQTDPVLTVVTQDPLVYPQVTVTKAGTPPGTVESFEIDIDNNAAFIQADSGMKPYDVIPGELKVSGTMTLLFESDADYRRFHTASPTGTSTSAAQYAESLSILVQSNSFLLAQIDMASIQYTAYPVMPDAGGAPIRVAIGFRSKPDPATVANYISITTRNAIATY